MTLRPALLCPLLYTGLLRCASWLVPVRQRGEWRREWSAELWHVRQSCAAEHGDSWIAEREVAAFCLGAFQDAVCLRQHFLQAHAAQATMKGSATKCIAWLMGLMMAGYFVALMLPGVSVILHSPHYRDAKHLMLIHDGHYSEDSVPTISVEQYKVWKQRRQEIFDGFAFYRVTREAVESGGHTTMRSIAPSSANLFELLGLPIRFLDSRDEGSSAQPRLILSDQMWKREFGGDSGVIGREIQVGRRMVVVAGVAAEGSWRLPAKVDAWLLEPDSEIARGGAGFVVGHLTQTAIHSRWGENWHMSAPKPDGEMADFFCGSLTERTRGPNQVFLFAIFLACLALPATTSLPLGEYRQSSRKLSWPTRLVRWTFLASKIALLMPIVYLASLDISHLRAAIDPISSEYLQLVSAFSICLFGLRWTLRDQRQRCPVCLRKLTHPARVGQPSRNFLAWNGTELICVGGHGLLHVPEISTSWFSEQRWLYLDPSWDVLFAETGLLSSGYF
jgi:hypothetical protein